MATLAGIAEALAAQLGDERKAPFFADDPTEHSDSRTWDDRGSSLLVDASVTAMENHLDGFEGIADAERDKRAIRLLPGSRTACPGLRLMERSTLKPDLDAAVETQANTRSNERHSLVGNEKRRRRG